MSRIIRIMLIIIGSISIGLGVLGIIMPLLPTTPFLLLGAACYFRSSQKLYDRLIGNKWLGPYIKNYREKREIPLRAKIIALTLLWLTTGYSGIFVISSIIVRVILIVVVIGVTWHVATLKTPARGKNTGTETKADNQMPG